MFTTRLISGIVLVILALILVGQGGALLLLTSAAISCIGLFELYRVMKMQDKLLGAVSRSGLLRAFVVRAGTVFQSAGYFGIDAVYDHLRGHLPKVRDRAGDGGLLWDFLCGSDVFLPLSDQDDDGRSFFSVADFLKLLGL